MEGTVEIKNAEGHSLEDYKQLCIYSFDVLIHTLKNLDHGQLKFPEKFKDKNFPLFVTWYSGEEKDLRGCIGTFQPEELEKNLLKYSYYAAFKDSRFHPISAKEIPHLHCGVSLLVNFEDGSDAFDWEVGKHGITIEFFSSYRYHNATFLPEIASERNWNKKTTLKQLALKAGYYGKLEVIIDKIKLRRYQSIKVGISHGEYKILKETSNNVVIY